jgi:hypothetical protein
VCATLLVTSQGPGELPARILRCVAVVVLSVCLRLGCVVFGVPFSCLFSFGMIPACFFYSLKEVQGYMLLVYGATSPVKEPGGLGRALSGGGVVCTVEAWRRYFWHCCYVLWYVCHCWRCGLCLLTL